MAGRDKWERRIAEVRPFFEIAGFALTTVTWVSLSFVVSFMVIRGFWTLSPPLKDMGTQGIVLYSVFAVPFALVAASSSIALLVIFWSLLLALKRDLEFGESKLVGYSITFFSKLWHYVIGGFIFMMIAVLVIQVLIALGEIKPPAG